MLVQGTDYDDLTPEERLAVLQGLLAVAGETAAMRAAMPDMSHGAGAGARGLPLGCDGSGFRYFALAPQSSKIPGCILSIAQPDGGASIDAPTCPLCPFRFIHLVVAC